MPRTRAVNSALSRLVESADALLRQYVLMLEEKLEEAQADASRLEAETRELRAQIVTLTAKGSDV